MISKGEKRIVNIDYLRAIAVLSVCFYHFITRTQVYVDYPALRDLASYGKYGVELFFLISGFIVPYAMYSNNYTLSGFFSFLSRRLVRIEIPYVVSMIFVLSLGYLATKHPLYKGVDFEVNGMNLLYHLGYINIFLDNKWINPVYWTLAIEFHFYLTIAFIYPVLFMRSWYKNGVYILLLLPLFFSSSFSIIRFYGYFLLGITVFLYYVEKIDKKEMIAWCIILTSYIIYFRGPFNIVVIAIFLTFVLGLENFKASFLGYIGKISFSLYLYHFIGNKFQNLFVNFANNEVLRFLLIPSAFVVSIILSHIMYITIEKYSVKLSRQIGYSKPVLRKFIG